MVLNVLMVDTFESKLGNKVVTLLIVRVDISVLTLLNIKNCCVLAFEAVNVVLYCVFCIKFVNDRVI